jgi:hypothetical protein
MEDRPTVPDHLVFLWKAFWDLSSDRQVGMALGPIPWSSIDRYSVRHGVNNIDEFEYMLALLKGMDEVYLEYQNKKGSKTSLKDSNKGFTRPDDKEVMNVKSG